MTARYIAKGNSYAAKEILKHHGFSWSPASKRWSREDGTFQANGNSTEEAVKLARAEIKEAGIDCDLVFIGDGFNPEEEAF